MLGSHSAMYSVLTLTLSIREVDSFPNHGFKIRDSLERLTCRPGWWETTSAKALAGRTGKDAPKKWVQQAQIHMKSINVVMYSNVI